MTGEYWTTDYWNALDAKEKLGPGVDVVGTATHFVKDQLQELKGKIFAGTSHVELGFWGKGKGSRGQGSATPESYGKEEREAMRQLATINEVELTTHASPQAGNLSGLGEKGFNDQIREQTLHEVEKAIDFAVDVSQGGPVTVHTGEYPRALHEAEEKFAAYGKEKEKAPVYLADQKTGALSQLPRDINIPAPAFEVDEKGEIKHDKEGRPIYKTDKYGRHKFEQRTYDYYKQEQNKERVKNELINHRLITEKEAKKIENPAQLFYLDYMRKELEQHESEELRYARISQGLKTEIKNLEKLEDNYDKLIKKGASKQEVNSILRDNLKLLKQMPDKEDIVKQPELYDIYVNNPVEFLKHKIDGARREASQWEEGAISYGRRVHGLKEDMKNIKPVHNVAMMKTADSLARAAMYAYDKEKKMKLKEPLYISPENMFPEQYGSHPRELKKMVTEARKAMTEKLKQKKGFSESQAQKIAEDHIKATFDIGHAYTWKKYFKGKDEDFDKWIVKEAGKLQKQGILGHVHITDNFGYDDEHLSPGEGSVPIKEFVKEIEKQGFKGKIIIEPGGQPEGQAWRATTSAWKTLNSPIYRIDSQQQSWGDIESSYFGRTGSPSYIVGDLAPSKDWAFWSETPIE